jgi:lipoate-protein ligase A
MPAEIRLLPFAVADGPTHMAADEVLLDAAAAGVASFRLYRWEPATLSLGYFQKAADRLQDPALAPLPWVRRATGGGAILHADDLTYALALPPALTRGRTPAQWHDYLHQTLTGLLQEAGIAAALATGPRRPAAELAFLCFAVPQPGDVLLGGRKIVGGAQRHRAGALLQHGTIQTPLPAGWAAELPAQLTAALGWRGRPKGWTAEEIRRTELLAEEKYRSPAWNLRR